LHSVGEEGKEKENLSGCQGGLEVVGQIVVGMLMAWGEMYFQATHGKTKS
jgi:hypothetical protein